LLEFTLTVLVLARLADTVFTPVFKLLVSFVVAADDACTFKISAKANSNITEHIDFRLI